MLNVFKKARIISYDSPSKTAQIHIFGMTEGLSQGLTATFAWPVGDDDRDTERLITPNNEVYIFFDGGDEALPVIAFYCSHGQGTTSDIRRIRQNNIELIANHKITMDAEIIHLKASKIIMEGDIEHQGDQHTTGIITADTDVIANGVSSNGHIHPGVRTGDGETLPPKPTGS